MTAVSDTETLCNSAPISAEQHNLENKTIYMLKNPFFIGFMLTPTLMTKIDLRNLYKCIKIKVIPCHIQTGTPNIMI